MLYNLTELPTIASHLPLNDYHQLRFAVKTNLPSKPNLHISAYKETCKLYDTDISVYCSLAKEYINPDSFSFLISMKHTMQILKSVKYMTTQVLLSTLMEYCGNTAKFNEIVVLFITNYLDSNLDLPILYELLMCSVNNDSIRLAKYLLGKGIDPSFPDNKPICAAVKRRCNQIVEILLQHPVDPTVNENYCLRKSIDNQDLLSFNLLLNDQRVDPTFSGYYAIHQIGSIGNLDLLKSFLKHSQVNIDDCGFLALCSACEYGNIDIAEYLINNFNIDPSLDNNYAIGIASSNGFANIVKLLTNFKSVNAGMEKSFTIRSAATNGHLQVVKVLAKLPNVDPTAMNHAAIRMAASNGHYEVVEYLMKIPKINPSALHNFALRKASQNGHLEIVKLLLTDERVQPSSHRYQSIKNAFENKHFDIALVLLTDSRVDKSFENNYALLKSAEIGSAEIYRLFVPSTQLNSQCLKLACLNGHVDLTQLILEGEVDPTANDYECLRNATANGHLDLLKLLLQDDRVDSVYASTLL
ncbi:hypothetical protein HDV01_005106 [Terramyces sp. JEL0728]|nr:hypothetical protein HDV01_005106 [Terramyces sp. JEL0728]